MGHLKEQSSKAKRPIIIWLFKDGKPGHEAQIEGLVKALGKHTQLQLFELSTKKSFIGSIFSSQSNLNLESLPLPDLIVGAGHRTHLWLLHARWRYGGKSVLLMKPSLPVFLFDLVLIPEHDCPPNAEVVVSTVGVLNRIEYTASSLADRGLILLGGQSRHCHWDSSAVVKQVSDLVTCNPDIKWELTTSRRTPDETLKLLSQLEHENCIVTPFEQTDRSWVSQRLNIASRVWVTQDSVSMIYESLTAGAEVGLIALDPISRTNRIVRSVENLKKNGFVVSDMKLPKHVQKNSQKLNEANRCAAIVFERFLDNKFE